MHKSPRLTQCILCIKSKIDNVKLERTLPEVHANGMVAVHANGRVQASLNVVCLDLAARILHEPAVQREEDSAGAVLQPAPDGVSGTEERRRF